MRRQSRLASTAVATPARFARFALLATPLVLSLAASLVASLAATPLAAQGAGGTPRLEFVAMDYAFRGPATATAGLTTIALRNTGTKLHHMQLYRLEEGKRLQDLFAILYRDKGIANAPAWAVPAGGPSAALPGRTIAVRQALAPGRYAVICWIPAADGQLHFMKGMMAELEVAPRPAGARAAADPAAEVRATLREYGVTFDVTPSARTRTIRIENSGRQAHEFLLVRLAPGKTVDDVAHWSERGQEGPAPVEDWSGMSGLRPGGVAWLDVSLRPGRYAVLCLAPDAGDGRPHLLHGFRLTFTVP